MSDSQVQLRPPSVLEDPSARSIARVYATALLDAAGGQAQGLLEELQSFVTEVLDPQPVFERLLCSAATTDEDKLRLVDRVVDGRGSELLTSLLRVLARHGRLDIVRAVLDQAVREHEKRSGKRRVRVVSATPLSQDSLASIQHSIAGKLGSELIVETQVDPTLVGGLVIRIEDTVYDGSVRNRLKQLRARMRERCLNEVQRGRDRFSHPEGN